jgi:hypothetical protein
MPRKRVTGIAVIGGLILTSVVSDAHAAVLYSTIAGATSPGSTQPTYSSSLTLSESPNDAGEIGFGDDYTSSSPGLTGAQINSGAFSNAPTNSSLISTDSYVQLTSISFYGDVEPLPNDASTNIGGGLYLYAEGADVRIDFYDASGRLDQQATIQGPTASASGPYGTGLNNQTSVQGPGLHTITLSSPEYIPASGYYVIVPYLPGSYNGQIQQSTPADTTGASLTGYFGAAPTVGSGTANTFASSMLNPNDENSSILTTNSTYSNLPNYTAQNPDVAGNVYSYTPSGSATSSGFLQAELDGNGLVSVPEPATLSLLIVGASALCSRRRRSGLASPSGAAAVS